MALREAIGRASTLSRNSLAALVLCSGRFVNGQTETFPIWVYGATRQGVPPQVNVMGTLLFLTGVGLAVANVVALRRRRL